MQEPGMSYPLLTAGRESGTVRVYREGLMTVVEGRSAVKTAAVTRLAPEGGAALGVMLPGEGGLWFKKRYSRSEAARLGLQAAERFVTVTEGEPEPQADLRSPPPPESDSRPDLWSYENAPGRYFAEGELRRAWERVTGALSRRRGGGVDLALELREDAPFQLMSAFLYGREARMEGRSWLVFTVRDGALEPPVINGDEPS